MLEPTGKVRSGRPEYRLAQDYTRSWRTGLINESVTVPRGYVTDLASIPDLPRFLKLRNWSPDGPWRNAAIVHDWLYSVGIGPARCSPAWRAREAIARWRADRIFRRLMVDDGVDRLTLEAFYAAVRAGGIAAFGRPEPINDDLVRRYWIGRD